jgi:hypothetical protein
MKPYLSTISYNHYEPYFKIRNRVMISRDPWCGKSGGITIGGSKRNVVFASMRHGFENCGLLDVYCKNGPGFIGRVRMYTK